MTQEEFAELLDVTRVTVSNWERGRKITGPVRLLLEIIIRRAVQVGPTLESLRDSRLAELGKVSMTVEPPREPRKVYGKAKRALEEAALRREHREEEAKKPPVHPDAHLFDGPPPPLPKHFNPEEDARRKQARDYGW